MIEMATFESQIHRLLGRRPVRASELEERSVSFEAAEAEARSTATTTTTAAAVVGDPPFLQPDGTRPSSHLEAWLSTVLSRTTSELELIPEAVAGLRVSVGLPPLPPRHHPEDDPRRQEAAQPRARSRTPATTQLATQQASPRPAQPQLASQNSSTTPRRPATQGGERAAPTCASRT